MLTEIMVT